MGSSGGSVALRAAGAAWTLWARCGQPRAQTIVSSSAAAWWSSPAQTAQVSTSAACGQDNSQPKLAIRLNDNLESRIAKITQRFQTLEQQLQGSDGAGQQLSGSQLQEAMKEYRRVQPVGSKYVEYQRLQQELRDVKSLLQPAATPPTPSTPSTPATGDEELRQMAEEEVQVLAGRLRSMEHELLLALLPSAQDEHMGAILEVRAGTGGEEAALFAADLVRMYQSYADQKGWQWELLEQSSAEAGGLKFASAAVTGGGAFSRLRHEAGVHRVQRVPSTEREGRVHTSTASVVVLPEADETEFVVREEDLRIEAHRASGAGGQHVNVTNSAVRITHVPTGIVVINQDERSQQRNRAKALRVLRARLLQAERQRQESLVSAERRASIGSGDRHERIRTYNFPQDRVTDHRVGVTLHGLEELMSGEGGSAQALDTVIDALAVQEQTRTLGELAECAA